MSTPPHLPVESSVTHTVDWRRLRIVYAASRASAELSPKVAAALARQELREAGAVMSPTATEAEMRFRPGVLAGRTWIAMIADGRVSISTANGLTELCFAARLHWWIASTPVSVVVLLAFGMPLWLSILLPLSVTGANLGLFHAKARRFLRRLLGPQ